MAHILVVDDDSLFRNMIVLMLSKENHKVTEAEDGQEGLEQANMVKPDLIITDILMPKMDGIELIQALAKQKNKIPIIAISGGRRSISASFNLESAQMMGIKVSLSKPFDREMLRNAIEQALS